MASGESLDVYIYVKPADIQDLTLWNDEDTQRPLDEIGVVGEYRKYNARTSPSSTLKAPGYEDLLIEVGEGVDNYFTMEPIKNYISSLTHKGTTYTIKDAKAREDIATKQDALTTQTAYTSKGTATKVPQITTNNLGQVTNITEVTITQPTVNNKTITIQKNSATVDSFTLNQSTDKTINITVPTKTSDITNDSGFLTSHQSIKSLKTDNTTAQTTSSSEAIAGSGTISLHKVSKTGSYDDLLNKPTIPIVNNSTILLTQGGVNKGSFTLNQATDSIINLDKSGAELIIVDNSGSTLPTPQTIGETFLNTTDKKIYTAEAGEYVTASDITNNGSLDISTGTITGFTTSKYLSSSSRGGLPIQNIDVHFKTGLDVSTKQSIINAYSFNSSTHVTSGCVGIVIENAKLYIYKNSSTSTECCSVQANTDYHIQGSLTSSMNNYYLTFIVKENNVTIVNSTSYSVNYTVPSGYLVFGVYRGSNSLYSAPFLGTLYGDTNWKGLVLESEGETGWDDGTALVNDAICYDTTNEKTIYYNNNILYESGSGLPDQSGQSGKYLTTDGTSASWATVQAGPKFLTFTNITASTWVADNTYVDYGYKCVLTCNGVTSSDYAQVIFNPSEADSGNYAALCLTDTNTVTIYSKVNNSITIPTIMVMGA